MKQLLIILIAATTVSCTPRKTPEIPYPQPPNDSVISFLPGIVSTGKDTIDFNATFSPDGRAFYFTRSQNRKWDIHVTRFENGHWTKAVKAGVGENDEYSEADPMFGPDGALYYISDRPRNDADTLRDFDIWRVKPMTNGGWSAPENITEVNTDSTEYYVSFAGDGTMYFASSRAGGYGAEDIYKSRRVNGTYTTPENLGPQINTKYSDHDPYLPINEKFIIYTSVDRPGGPGQGDLFFATKDENGNWQESKPMGSKFNTPTYEYCSYLSPDHKYFFFSSRGDVKWSRTEILPNELIRSLP